MAVNCFKKLNYHDNIPHLYRPALVRDVQTHKPEAKAALDHFDIASLADGWVDLYEETHVGHEWRSGLGHKLVVQQPDVRLLDGTYNIRAKDGTSGELGLYLSVGSADSDAWVNLHDRDDGSGRQQWAVESTKVDDNLLYRLYIQRGRSQGVRSTLSCLSETDSSLVDLWFNDDGSGRQQWWLIPLGNDCYCIYVAGGREKNRFLSRRKPDERYVDLWHSSGDHQVWSLQTIPADPADPAAAQHDLSAQGAVISPVPDKGRICKEFTNIVAAWEQDLISVVRQGTMVSGISGAPGWRIDNQENGLTGPRGPNRLRCNSIAVQKEGGPRNVYANVLVPNGYNIGKRRIRHALLQSQKCKKMVLLYVPKAQADQLPAQSDPHRADHFVQGLPWTIMMLDGASAVLA